MTKKRSKSPKLPNIPQEKRVTAPLYRHEDCDLAVQGQKIPLAYGDPVTRACIVRGIRQHPGFAQELHGQLPLFTRALNAREIMSGRIPDMPEATDRPYCIWYPQVASEETYRCLLYTSPSPRDGLLSRMPSSA